MFIAKIVQTSAMKACFRMAECSLSYAKIGIFGNICKFLGRKMVIMG